MSEIQEPEFSGNRLDSLHTGASIWDRNGKVLFRVQRLVRLKLLEVIGHVQTRAFILGLAAGILVAPLRLMGGNEVSPRPSLPLITTAAQIRKMTVREAKQSYAVRLRGVITYYDPEEPDLFVQDSTSGIWVNLEIVKPTVPLKAGDVVEVHGVTEAPDFAPQVGNPGFKVIGHAPLPPAMRVSFAQMASTQKDSQRVEVEGIVRKVFIKGNRLYLDVATADGRVTGRMPFYTKAALPQIVDARVRLRGTCGAQFNSKNQLTGIFINIPYQSEIEVLQPPPLDPFNAPVLAISDLLRFSPQEHLGHRIRVQGVVTLYRRGKAVFIQNESGSLYAQTQQDTSEIQPGEQVDVIGFPTVGAYAPELQDAILRRTGRGLILKPIVLSPGEALRGNFARDILFRSYDAELVQVAGRLTGSSLNPGEQILMLQDGSVVFEAELPDSRIPPAFASLREGSVLQVTGVCTIEVDENRQPIRFRIRLRSPEDVVVTHFPSWWNIRRTLTLIAVMILVIFAALVWAATLRRRVREATEVLRTTLESTADGILVVDRKGRTVTSNHKFAAMWRLPEELVSSGDNQRIIQDVALELKDPEKFLGRVRQLYADSNAASDDVLDFLDGRVFERHSEPQMLNGRSIGRVWGFRDVTERRRAEEALNRERTLLRTVIDNLPDQIYVKDIQRRFSVANQAMARLLGCSSPEFLLGKENFDVYPGGLARQYEAEEQGVLQSGEALVDRELELIDPIVGSRWLLSSKVPLRDATGKITGIVGISRDITQRKSAEQDLQAAKEAAEAGSEAKSEFLANMSHEIRTPLNGVIGMTDLALDTELSKEQREYLETVKMSADSLLTVINDILDFSKIEAGKIDLDLTDFNLRECLEAILKTLALRADEKGLELLCDVAGQVPEAVRGDSNRLRQIVINLVGNAIKFTGEGEVALSVKALDAEGEGDLLEFTVADTGIGIPTEKQKLIFEPFSQADASTTRKYGGTGLGLTISTRLVGMMGGRIWVESEPGCGTRFHFTARLKAADAQAIKVEMMAPPEVLRGVKVLIVDDNRTNRGILERMLSRWEMKPRSVEGGEEALGQLAVAREAGDPYRLILTDMHMPEMDGFSLVERIRESPQLATATIMMLTSAGHRGDAARCQELGIVAYLLKPIRQSELREAIARAVGAGEEKGEIP